MDGMKDEEIKFSYEMVFDDFCELIRQYVFDYISSNIIPLTDIDNGVVAEDVVKLFVSNNEISILDLLLSRYDRLIEAMAAKNRSKNEEKRRSDMPNTYEYIDSQILYKTQNSELLKNIINKIDTTLRDRGILPKEIVSGEYDAEIRNLYHDYYSESVNSSLRENSIQIDGVPRKIKRNSKKQNIPQAISSVLIVATLLSLLAVGGHELGENIRIDTAKKNLSEIDSYSYSQMNGIYDRGIEPTAANILKTYDEYSKFNNTNFNYLAFYRAYISANQNQMNVMDTVINEVKKDARNNSGYTDLYYALRSNSCYLDFMYDRLYEMGFTEIKDEKYFDLLAKYVQHKNNHPYDDPAEFLTDKEKRLLSKVKDKYEELSEYYLIELGLYLDDPEYFEKYSNSGGRNHI